MVELFYEDEPEELEAEEFDYYEDQTAYVEEEARYQYRLYHEETCPRNKTIKVPTYPGSHKLFEMRVCAECEPTWHDYRYSSSEVFFV